MFYLLSVLYTKHIQYNNKVKQATCELQPIYRIEYMYLDSTTEKQNFQLP